MIVHTSKMCTDDAGSEQSLVVYLLKFRRSNMCNGYCMVCASVREDNAPFSLITKYSTSDISQCTKCVCMLVQ